MRVILEDKAGEREFDVELGLDDSKHRVRSVHRSEAGEESFRSVKRLGGTWKRAVDAAKVRQSEAPDEADSEPRDQTGQEPIDDEREEHANDDATPVETLVVQFEDQHHYNLHRVLLEAGFTFEVTSMLYVNRRYSHPRKPLLVELGEWGGEFLEPKVFFQGKAQTDSEYSEAEWKWLSQPDTPDGVVESLRRELHILLDIRPHYMSGEQTALAG